MTKTEHTDIDSLAAKVGSFIDGMGLIEPNGSILVGVSGGADSVALLSILRELAPRDGRGYHITAAHLNHCLRDSADADGAFVEQLTEKWEIPLICERRDVAGRMKRTGEGIEEAARKIRYEFLAESAQRVGASSIAVGHHSDDNVETILHRIVRGTHLRGLAGIRPARKMEGMDAMLVRPLLDCSRGDIEDYCKRNNLSWRTDPSNSDTAFSRNFIRHDLLKLLRERMNPQADQAILRLSAAAAEAEEYLSLQAESILRRATFSKLSGPSGSFVLNRRVLVRHHTVIRTCVLRLALERLGVPMRTVGAEKLCTLDQLLRGEGPSAVSLPGGFSARREQKTVTIAKNQSTNPQEP